MEGVEGEKGERRRERRDGLVPILLWGMKEEREKVRAKYCARSPLYLVIHLISSVG